MLGLPPDVELESGRRLFKQNKLYKIFPDSFDSYLTLLNS